MRSLIHWFIQNPVTANLLALLIILGGLVMLQYKIIVEFFPDTASSVVNVRTVVNGGTPTEVEEGVTTLIEEAIRDIEGIDEVASTSNENLSSIRIILVDGYEPREVLDKVRNAVNAINQFPDNAETPIVDLASRKRSVGDLAVVGPFTERELRLITNRVREELQNKLQSTALIEEEGFRAAEIAIEIDQAALIANDLTFAQIQQAVLGQSVDLSTGTIKSREQELLLSSKSRARTPEELVKIVIKKTQDGKPLYLGDIAKTIQDGFADDSYVIRYRGEPSMLLALYRVGNGNVLEVMDTVHKYIHHEASTWLPEKAQLAVVDDDSLVVQSRIDLLLTNAWQGGFIVVALLMLFLRPAIAFWVLAGMAVSLCGGLLVMGLAGVTLNMMTLFAFIMVLGMVVDDATVIGENIYTRMKNGEGAETAVLEGAHEVAVPVTFGMLTTVAAFAGLMFIQGSISRMMGVIPLVIIPVMLFSFFESKFILPAHLRDFRIAHSHTSIYGHFLDWQERFADHLERFVDRIYRPTITHILEWRYTFLAAMIGLLVLLFATLPMGYLRFIFFPNIERDTIDISVNMQVGTPFNDTVTFIHHIEKVVQDVGNRYRNRGTDEPVFRHVLARIGDANGASHTASLSIELIPSEERLINVRVRQLVNELRQNIVTPPKLANMAFRAEIGLRGSAIMYFLSHPNREQNIAAVSELETFLLQQTHVFDVSSDLSLVKDELVMNPKPQLDSMGLSLLEVVRQVRHFYYGLEIDSYTRGRDEVSIILRLPHNARQNLEDLNQLQVRSAQGEWILLRDVVELKRQKTTTTNRRSNYQAVMTIQSNFDKERGNLPEMFTLIENKIESMKSRYPGLSFQRGGETVEQQKTFSSLPVILFSVLAALYFLIAVPTQSYIYPLIVLLTLPFAVGGALLGHLLLGKPLTMPSVLGIVAMLGVAVNAAIILVVFINDRLKEGHSLKQAIIESGANRFRAVFLTSATTIGGLTPLMLEKSVQAQFLIPVAISMVFGVLVSALATMFIVPVLYHVIADFKFKQTKNNNPESVAPLPHGTPSL